MCSYEWIEYPNDVSETEIQLNIANPEFNYENSHTFEVTDELCQIMRFNTLSIKVWGMVEGNKNKLSDKRKVGGTTWAELRETAMKPDFKKRSPIYVSFDSNLLVLNLN